MSDVEYYQLAIRKGIYSEPYDMDDAGDRMAVKALAKHEARDLVENNSQEKCEELLKASGNRRTFGRREITSAIQKGDMRTNDEEAFIDLYAERFYTTYTKALAEKAGIDVNPYELKMPWGAWEFDFSDKLSKGRSGVDWYYIDKLAKEQAVLQASSGDQDYAQYLLSDEEVLRKMIDTACGVAFIHSAVWASDDTLFRVFFDTAFKTYYLAELKKKTGVLSESEALLVSADVYAELDRLANEQEQNENRKKDQQRAEQEQKRRELFPDPEPLRVEIAGTVVNFTTWDAVLVVYMDNLHKGKTVEIKCEDARSQIALRKNGRHKAEVIERSIGNMTVCSAIFPRIPVITEYHKKALKSVKYVNCKVTFSFLEPEFTIWEEEVTLFKGQVTELDWQKEIVKPKTSTTPAISTTGTRATVTRIERDANEYRYYIELSDPGYIDGVLELVEPMYYPLNEEEAIEGVSSSSFAVSASNASPSYHAPLTPLPSTSKSEGLKGGRRLHLKKR